MLARLAPTLALQARFASGAAAAVVPCVFVLSFFSIVRARASIAAPALSQKAQIAHTHHHSVSVTVVGLDGTRHVVRALPGTSLVNALQEADVDEGEKEKRRRAAATAGACGARPPNLGPLSPHSRLPSLSRSAHSRLRTLTRTTQTNNHNPDAIAFSPEGRGAAEAVVQVPAEVAAAVPAHRGAAAAALAELAAEVRPNTRLASAVTLTPALDGAVLALGKLRPWKTL
jgi:hypothetical protein